MTAAASLAALCFAAMPPAEIVLNAHLANWEKATAKANSYSGKFTMTRTTVPFGKDHIYEGRLLLMKPNLFRISIQEVHQRDTYQAFICDGKSIFIYNWSTKTATVFPLSDFEILPGIKRTLETPVLDLFMSFTAADAKKRFCIEQFKGNDNNSVYLDIKPSLAKNKKAFERLRVELYGHNIEPPLTPYLPARMWIELPNGDREYWSFDDQQLDPRANGKAIEPEVFQFEEPKGKGWKINRMAAPRKPMELPKPSK